MILSLFILSLFSLRVSAGFDRRPVPAFALRKPLKKNHYNH
jgi:hypothetical protein